MLPLKFVENLKKLTLERAQLDLQIHEEGCLKGNAFAKAHLLQAQQAVEQAERELKQFQDANQSLLRNGEVWLL